MNTYEFWNEMDKIFDAVLAYQEKNIEFNKRFINPWLSLGNVFDKQNKSDMLTAHKNAIELDPLNATNWYELGKSYTRAGSFDESIQAYQKALDLGLKFGELYKNMALAYAMSGKYQESLPFFEKGLELLEKDEEKVSVWNQVGNVYRKLNNYEKAFQAFQQADQLENKGDIAPVEPSGLTGTADVTEKPAVEAVAPVDEFTASQPDEEAATVFGNHPAPLTAEVLAEVPSESVSEVETTVEELDDEEFEEQAFVEEPQAEENVEGNEELHVIFDLDFSKEGAHETKQTWAEDESSREAMPVSDFVAELEKQSEFEATIAKAVQEKTQVEVEEMPERTVHGQVEMVNPSEHSETFALYSPEYTQETEAEDEPVVDVQEPAPLTEIISQSNPVDTLPTEDELDEIKLPDMEGFVDTELSNENEPMPVFSAYEVYLKNNITPIGIDLATSDLDNAEEGAQDVSGILGDVAVTEIGSSFEGKTDLTEDVDTKNAQVWNELGNVYFNAGAYEDAVAAYTKAIELDKSFAWPYSNLALSYVQKGRYDEATFLYQRGIELFTNDKDKALTWNRLGNLYRRLNDYENAITAYQHADELDPTKAAITRQSQYSLLGSEKVNLEVGYTL